MVSLTVREREIIGQGLFQATLTERLLLQINQSQNVFLRDIILEARAISAHARLGAALG